MSVTNFPTTDGHRTGATISTHGTAVTLTLRDAPRAGSVLFQLPGFVGNIAQTTSGSINQATSTVTLSPATRKVTVHLRHAL
jgi:hypothetical protein